MAAFVATRTIRAFDPRTASPLDRQMRALNSQETVVVGSNNISAADAALRKIQGLPQFEIFGTTDSNTAAASSPVINLTDEGVTFPANTRRIIRVHTIGFNGANRYEFVTEQRVMGATDPTLQGPERFLTECDAVYGFTTADGTTTTEVAAECIGPEWWDGASPVSGNVASNAFTIQWLGTNSPVRVLLPGDVENFDAAAIAADARSFQHGNVSLTNGTSDVFISDVATPTAANFANASVVRVRAKLLPIIQTPVLIDTATTPDKVFIGALGISSDVVTWVIRVFIGDLVTVGPLV